ncbi:MAG: hypothetical protein ABIJ36_03220 [Patescibacteria group bacterium]|nr:hypothetical protein [Patescibacteria group bacterium]
MSIKSKILNNKLSLPVLFLFTLIVIGGLYYFKQLSNRIVSVDKTPFTEKIEKTSLQPSDNDKALLLVKNLPEVQEWLNLFINPDGASPSTNGKPVIEVDSVDGSVYTIHVYESLTDHNATFNWYYVDLNTESIKDFFGKEY